MSQHIGPRVISATGGSIKRVGNYRVHTFPSELVTDGLVLNLDAGDPRSYSGSGTTWTDLSGNGTIGTLTNGPTYDTANGGGISFTSSSQVVVLNKHDIIGENQNFTIESWIYRTTSSIDYIFGNYNSGFNALEFYVQQSNVGIYWQGVSIFTTSGPISTNTWYHVAAKREGDNVSVYVNGVLYASGTITSLVPTNSSYPFTIGNAYNYATESFAGTISIVRVYNRALSNAEIAQNYDALKVRYTSYTNTFTPLCGGASGRVEVLCVAGGGGGGSGHGGGGGGAGGLIYNSAFSVNSNSAISLSIGSGGHPQNNGSNTTFSSLTSIGGGAGGSEGTAPGNSGGSGGGGSGYATATTGGSGTSGQGFAGGNGGFPNTDNSTYGHGGGGGGAGGIGSTGGEVMNSSQAGNGGVGLSYSISGESKFYAGGGGGGYWGAPRRGGLGGSGVGGNGSYGDYNANISTNFGENGIPNTGSGGGGSPGSATGANTTRSGGCGSNGIVIVRYPASDYNVELLIVGGGGAGGGSTNGNGGGGGGGAGGLLYYSSYPVSAGTKYTVTVGAGGIGQNATTGANGGNGNNSVFGSLIAFGGGGGSNGNGGGTANNGGSGGGGGYRGYTTVSNGGTGASGQGNNGSGVSSTSAGGAGGEGALTIIGTEYSSGGPVIGYGVKPSTTSSGSFLSSTSISLGRTAYVMDGGSHRWYYGSTQTVTENSAVTTSEVMRLTSTGNIGIGTNNPSYKLDVLSGSDTDVVRFRGTSSGVRFQSNSTTMDIVSHNGSDTNTRNLVIRQYGASTGILLDTNGNVGIRTTNPAFPLEVVGGNNGVLVAKVLNGQYGSISLVSEEGNQLDFGYARNASNYGAQTTAGDFSVKTTAPRLHFPVGQGNANSVMVLKSDGNVGIGTTNPTAKLHLISSSTNSNIFLFQDTFESNVSRYIRSSNRSGNNAPGYSSFGLTIDNETTTSGANEQTTYLQLTTRDPSLNGNHGTTSYITLTTPSSQGSYGTGQFDFYIRNGIQYTIPNDPSVEPLYWMSSLMTIKSDGNVGIGITNPIEKLHINGITLIESTPYQSDVQFQTNTRFISYQKTQGYNQTSWYYLQVGSGSDSRAGSIRLRVNWTTRHASGVGYHESHIVWRNRHDTSKCEVMEFGRLRENSWNGSYYSWTSTPTVYVYNSDYTGASAGIWVRIDGHMAANSSTYDGGVIHHAFIELYANNWVTTPTFGWNSNFTPGLVGAQITPTQL